MEATMNHKPLAGLIPIVVVLVLGAACSGDDDDPALVDSASVDRPATETTDATDPGDAEESSEPTTETGGGGEDTGGGSLGGSTGELPNFDTGAPVSLRLDVTSLERNGDLVELGMTLTNEDEELEFEPVGSFKDPEFATANVYDLSGVRLIDQGERKAYLPVIDSAGVCLCTGDLFNVTVPPGDSLELDATFGGIPDSVTTLDLDVPGFSAIAGLEVEG
jgi:hypothetical protein